MSEEKKIRFEHDSIGTKEVSADAYYGVQTLRTYENFYIIGLKMHPELIVSVMQIKRAAMAIAAMIPEEELGPENIIPVALNKGAADAVANAVAEEAVKMGIARTGKINYYGRSKECRKF